MNNFCFTGNLGNQAEQRFTPSGDSIVNFSVAVKAGFGDKAVTTWVRCNMWGKRGESVIPYLTKGQLVGVSGELANREYQDKDGQTRTSLEVRVNDVTLLGNRERGETSDNYASEQQRTVLNQERGKQKSAPANGSFDDLESEIPFVSNIIHVSDTMGRPKSLKRSKREKGLQGVPGNEGYF